MTLSRFLFAKLPSALLILFLLSGVHAPAEEPSRPKIGLCLGGGGAKGFAHIGVLQYLEEQRVPIDLIGGTSMGAIVSGLYAAGLSPDQIESEMNTQNWWALLEDMPSRRMLTYRRKLEQRRYISNFEIGLDGWKPLLRPGQVAGQRMNSVLQELTSAYAGVEDFDQLRIPFRAVATDVQTGEQVVLRQGNLAQAIRASMAVPGAFTPVNLDGRQLVDGGLVNNVPVSVLREMGADIVIAVDVIGLDDWSTTEKPINSSLDILGQTMLIMQQPQVDAQLKQADIVIQVPIHKQGMGDFHKSRDIIPLGYTAAKAVAEALQALQIDEAAYAEHLEVELPERQRPLTIRSVGISGQQRVDERSIRSRIRVKPGDTVSVETLGKESEYIQAMGDFTQVRYELQQDGDAYDLTYDVEEKSWGPTYLRSGLRLETDFENNTAWNLIIGYNRRQLNALGAEMRVDAKVGQETGLGVDLYQPLSFRDPLFLAPSLVLGRSRRDLFSGDEAVSSYDVEEIRGALDLGWSLREIGEIRVGAEFRRVRSDEEPGMPEAGTSTEELGALRGRLVFDRLDDAFFPRKGYLLNLFGRAVMESMGADREYEVAEAQFLGVASLGENSFALSARAGGSFDSDVPLYDQFELGGFGNFSGLAPGQLRGPYVGVLSLAYRRMLGHLPPGLGDGIYFNLKADSGQVWEEQEDLGDDLIYGGTVALSADTLIGPIYMGYGYAEGGNRQFYFSLGAQF